MSYLFKQKLDLRELANLERQQKRIIIFEPEQYLAALYAHYLRAHNFDVKHCPHLPQLKAELREFLPQILILNAEQSHYQAGLGIADFKRILPELLIITTGYNSDSENLKRLMAAGVASHINRKLSRPQDLVAVVNSLL